jgi:hypothetical protein
MSPRNTLEGHSLRDRKTNSAAARHAHTTTAGTRDFTYMTGIFPGFSLVNRPHHSQGQSKEPQAGGKLEIFMLAIFEAVVISVK